MKKLHAFFKSGCTKMSHFQSHSAAAFKNFMTKSAWLAQSVERVILDLGVVSSSPMLGIELTLKINQRHVGGSVG